MIEGGGFDSSIAQVHLESRADGEVEGASGFAAVTGEGAAVFESDGADGEIDADFWWALGQRFSLQLGYRIRDQLDIQVEPNG